MPLIHSNSKPAFKANIQTLMNEVGKSPHVQSREQALAIAYSTGRRAAKAHGGGVSGFLNSSVPGRTDRLPITVGGGAYVLPADHVAALGQGNSLAGANMVNKMFKMGPYGSAVASPHAMRAKRHLADGGGVGQPTPIVAAGGEIVIPPEKIIEKYGDLGVGHKQLDTWVNATRKDHIKTLRGLKPPKRD